MPLEWSIGEPREGCITARLKGGLTLGPQLNRLSQQLLDRIRKARAVGLILDLSELTSLDSAGLGELVILYTAASEHACRVVLAAAPQRVTHMMVTTRLDGLIESFDSIESARAALRRK